MRVFFAVTIIAAAGAFASKDFWLSGLYGDEYKEAMFQCDHAMREHFIAKSRVTLGPSDSSVKQLNAAELGLLHCHEYDKLRKQLTQFGMSPEALQLLGLEALEEKEFELSKFVEIHQFNY